MPKGQAEHFAAARDLFVMLDEVVEGFSLVDTDARIVWLNDKQAELMGLASVEDAIGVEIERFIPHSDGRSCRRQDVGSRSISGDLVTGP